MNRRTLSGPAGLLLAGLVTVLSQVPASAHTHSADAPAEEHLAHTLVYTQEVHLHEMAPQDGAAANEIAHLTAAHHDADAEQHSDGASDASHSDTASHHADEADAMTHHQSAEHHHQN